MRITELEQRLETEQNELKKHVIEWVIEKAQDYNSIESIFVDLQMSGCASGLVSHLVYYSDTTAFHD